MSWYIYIYIYITNELSSFAWKLFFVFYVGNKYSDKATEWVVWSVNPGMGTWFFPSPKHPDRLWTPPTILFSGYCGSSMGLEQPGHEINRLPPSGAFMVWTGILLQFYVGYTACPESFFTDIPLASQGYCVSFKTNRLPTMTVRSWRYYSDCSHHVRCTLHISQALLL